MRQHRAVAARAGQELLRTQRRHHRRSLCHAVARRQRQPQRHRPVQQRRPGGRTAEKNNPEFLQPRHGPLLAHQALQLGGHERERPAVHLVGQHRQGATLDGLPVERPVLTAGQRTAQPGHEAADVIKREHADRVHLRQFKVPGESPHRRCDRRGIVPGEAHLPAGPARRDHEPARFFRGQRTEDRGRTRLKQRVHLVTLERTPVGIGEKHLGSTGQRAGQSRHEFLRIRFRNRDPLRALRDALAAEEPG